MGLKPGSRGDQACAMLPITNVFRACALSAFNRTKPNRTKFVVWRRSQRSGFPAPLLHSCTWKDDSTHPEVIRPFSDHNDIFRVFALPKWA